MALCSVAIVDLFDVLFICLMMLFVDGLMLSGWSGYIYVNIGVKWFRSVDTVEIVAFVRRYKQCGD